MPFLCPLCKSATLVPDHLDAALATDRCTTCNGHWLTAPRYAVYLAATAESSTPATQSTAIAPADSAALKRCPACTKFMHYYRVAHDLAFGIDKCNTCGGIWLNAQEWPALVARNFHRQLQSISTDAWQAQVRSHHRATTHRTTLVERLGAEDFAELQRIGEWIADHSHQREIMAYIHHLVGERSASAPRPPRPDSVYDD